MSEWFKYIIANDDGFSFIEWVIPLIFIGFAFFGKIAESFKKKLSEDKKAAEPKRYKPLRDQEDQSKRYKPLAEPEEVKHHRLQLTKPRLGERGRGRQLTMEVVPDTNKVEPVKKTSAGRVRRAVAASRRPVRQVARKAVSRPEAKVEVKKVDRPVAKVIKTVHSVSPLERIDQGNVLKNAIIYSEILARPLALRDESIY
jgi:hypothetical protein